MLPDKLNKVADSLAEVIGNLDGYSKELLGIQENTLGSTAFDLIFDVGVAATPVVSNFVQGLQIRNLKNVLKEIDKVIQTMNVTFKEHEEKFIQEKTLPLILKNAIQEEQEEKIRIMVNGFESIIYDSMYEEDDLYEYYDVLKSLRYKEIARMLQLYDRGFQDQETYNTGNFEFVGTSREYIDNKLVRLGLGTFGPHEDTRPTQFGERFIHFFRNRKIDD